MNNENSTQQQQQDKIQATRTTITMTEKAPKRTSMSGMIHEANKVLDWSMSNRSGGGLHPDLFGPALKGICFLSAVEASFIFSGNVGTGIVLARNPEDGSWSPPSAIGLSGVGWGIQLGATVKHLVYLIYDDWDMKSLSGDAGISIGTKMEAALLNWGRSAELTTIISNKGLGSDVALHYSQGVFSGFSVEAALLNPRSRVNERFYGKKVRPSEILFEEGAVEVPEGTSLPQLYAKLEDMCHGRRRRRRRSPKDTNTTAPPPPTLPCEGEVDEERGSNLLHMDAERRQDDASRENDAGSGDTDDEEEKRQQYAIMVGKTPVLVSSN